MLNRRRTRFVHEYLVDLNGRQAAIRAGYDPKAARRVASDLLATDEVRAAVEKAMAARAARLGITPEQVLQRWWDIANADPAELIEHRRVCCRHCYGKDHRYQRTPSEMAKAIDAFNEAQMLAESKGERFACTLDPQGGIGYDARKDPNPDCPECFGEGVALVHAKDTRDLSPTAKRLYAGVKKTGNGVEITMHSRSRALENIARHLGMFTVKVEHDISGNLADRLREARERSVAPKNERDATR